MDEIFESSFSNTKVLLIISSSKIPVAHQAVQARPIEHRQLYRNQQYLKSVHDCHY